MKQFIVNSRRTNRAPVAIAFAGIVISHTVGVTAILYVGGLLALLWWFAAVMLEDRT